MSKKDKEFIRDFIKLYLKRRELDLFLSKDKKPLKYKEKVKRLDNRIKRKLPKYPILFDNDMKF